MLTVLLLTLCLVFVLALMQASKLNARLRALGKRPMPYVVPVVAFVVSLAVGLGIGLIIVDGFVVYRNSKARRLIAASMSN